MIARREMLKAGLAAGLFAPLPYAWVWAQSDGSLKLLRLPKVALVLGNSKYKDAPLKNPANDAKAIGEALTAAGFAVTAKLDATRMEMAAALDAYVKELAAKKCVGLFYYAGHGVQLAWKNYMLPVDAEIDTIDDVQKKAVEVNALTDGLVKAVNPLNVIILDACRDNPFGTAKQPQQKGLSQMDAPHNTILAYATAPGNVASDGEGANGLYTENFLKEVKVPEAKLEDVFKRVRLAVRRKSNGAQIPWESTSLEEDFWFLPPKELKKLSDAEKERAFTEEADAWAKAKDAQAPGPIEDYLRRYPNGNFAELAQLQLDRLLAKAGEKKIIVASQEGNPFTKGSAEANIAYRVGDRYEFRVMDPISKVVQRTMATEVTQITDSEVNFSGGQIIDLLGNAIRFGDGRRFTPNQLQPLEYAVGKRWITHFVVTTANGQSAPSEFEIRIASRDRIAVPAGTFDAFRIEGHGISHFAAGPVRLAVVRYMAPDKVRVAISREERRTVGGRLVFAELTELVSYKQQV